MTTTEPEVVAELDKALDKAVCAEDGCITLLSVYNELDYCSLHQPMIIPRMRGKVL